MTDKHPCSINFSDGTFRNCDQSWCRYCHPKPETLTFKAPAKTKPLEADWVVVIGQRICLNDNGKEVRYKSFSGCEGWIKRRREEGYEQDYQIGWAYK